MILFYTSSYNTVKVMEDDMVFKMQKIGRTIELDDDIVSKYLQTVEQRIITEAPFILVLKQDFGHYPTEE